MLGEFTELKALNRFGALMETRGLGELVKFMSFRNLRALKGSGQGLRLFRAGAVTPEDPDFRRRPFGV